MSLLRADNRMLCSGDILEAAPQLCTSVVLLLAREQSHGKCFFNQTLDELENQTNVGLIFHESLENLIPSPVACSSLCYFLILLLAAHQVNGRFHAASRSACNFQAMDITSMLPVSVFQLHVDPTIFTAAEIYIFIFACLCLTGKGKHTFHSLVYSLSPVPKNGWPHTEKTVYMAMTYSTNPSSHLLSPVLQYQV